MSIETKISDRLKEIEREHDCRVLFAAESGSRAWGFPSPDSDYDARFIYTHSLEWHLQIGKKKDTIEKMLPDDLDISGWELLKTLQLFHGCNLALFEWLGSPIVYLENDTFTTQLRELIPACFNARKALHHYLSLAHKVFDTEISNKTDVKVKKLFYVLRPLLCSRWILENRTMPPTKIQDVLRGGVAEDSVVEWVLEMIEHKHTAEERHLVNVSQRYLRWIEQTLKTCDESAESVAPPALPPTQEPLNVLLRETISVGNHSGYQN